MCATWRITRSSLYWWLWVFGMKILSPTASWKTFWLFSSWYSMSKNIFKKVENSTIFKSKSKFEIRVKLPDIILLNTLIFLRKLWRHTQRLYGWMRPLRSLRQEIWTTPKHNSYRLKGSSLWWEQDTQCTLLLILNFINIYLLMKKRSNTQVSTEHVLHMHSWACSFHFFYVSERSKKTDVKLVVTC